MSASGHRNFARNSVKILSLLLLASVAALPALAQDTQPPVLTSFTFSPMAVDTTTSSATVTVTAQVTDNLSGVAAVDVDFVSPSGTQAGGCGMSLISGTNLNGTYQGTVGIPIYSEAGTWTVFYVYVADNINNNRTYHSSDLTALGFPTQLHVTSNQDLTPPALTSFTFSPMAVDTTTRSATVTGTAQVTDNLSGVAAVDVDFVSPSGTQAAGCGMSLISGTNFIFNYPSTAEISTLTQHDTLPIFYVYVADNINNNHTYHSSDLTAL